MAAETVKQEGAAALETGSVEKPAAPKTEFMKYSIEKKVYYLRIKKRFEYVKMFNLVKRLADKEQSPLARALGPLMSKLSGKKKKGGTLK